MKIDFSQMLQWLRKQYSLLKDMGMTRQMEEEVDNDAAEPIQNIRYELTEVR